MGMADDGGPIGYAGLASTARALSFALAGTILECSLVFTLVPLLLKARPGKSSWLTFTGIGIISIAASIFLWQILKTYRTVL